MTRFSGGLLAGLLTVLAACGGTDDYELAQRTEALAACLPTDITWPAGTAIDQGVCAGPWQYARHVQPCLVGGTSDPSGAVCGPSGAFEKMPVPATCRSPLFPPPAEKYKTVTIQGTTGTKQVCEKRYECYYECGDLASGLHSDEVNGSQVGDAPALPGDDPAPQACYRVCIPVTECWEEPTCTFGTKITNELNKYQEPWRSQITQELIGCTVTLGNVPEIYPSGTDATVCGTTLVDDLSRPIYNTCENPSACGLQYEAGQPKPFYSPPGLTYTQVYKSGSGLLPIDWYAAAPELRAPKCLTCEDLPVDTSAQVDAKFNCYKTILDGLGSAGDSSAPYGAALAKDSALPRKLVERLKLLLEYKGDQLTEDQRAYVRWLHQSLPLERTNCGDPGAGWLLPLPDGTAPLSLESGFEGVDVAQRLAGWEAKGTVTVVGDGRTGSWSAKVGPGGTAPGAQPGASWISRAFTVPGGTLPKAVTFYYRTSCETGTSAEGATWQVWDNTTRGWAALASGVAGPSAPTCAASWTPVTLTFGASVAGHSVTLYLRNYDNAATAANAATYYDDVAWTAVPGETDALLVMCDRLNQNHVPEAVRRVMAPFCVNTASNVKQIPWSYSQRQAFTDRYSGALFGLFEKDMGVLPGALLAERVGLMRQRLSLLADWYDYANFVAGAPDNLHANSEDVAAELSALAGRLYNGAQETARKELADRYALPGTNFALAMDEWLGKSFSADRVMLLAAFPKDLAVPLPLTKAPLLEVVSDALRPISNRLGEVDLYHDVACRFQACTSGAPGELSQIQSAIGLLPDAQKLADAPKGAIRTAYDGDDWVAVFAAIAARHNALRSAIADATGIAYDAKAFDAAWTDAPQAFSELASVVRENRRRVDNYNKSGLFLADATNQLSIGIHPEKLPLIQNDVNQGIYNLGMAIDAYNTSRQTLVNNLLAEMQGIRTQASIESQIRARLLTIERQSENLAGLRLNAQIEGVKLADFARSYKATVEAFGADPNFVNYRFETLTPLSHGQVSAADVAWTGPAKPAGILQIAVPQWTLQANKGDLVSFTVAGQWTPTCALTHPPAFADNITLQASPTSLAGPEGYAMTFTNGKYVAKAYSVADESSRWKTKTDSERACAGVKVSVGGSFSAGPISFGAEAYGMAETCASTEWGSRRAHTTNDSTSSGTDTRNSAAFAYGLRLPNTPFPEYPVGSLLLVSMQQDGAFVPADVLDIQVLQPRTSFVAPANVDLYLVVNDVKDSVRCAPSDANKLTVSVDLLRGLSGALSDAFGVAMAEAHDTIVAQAQTLLKQGSVSPSELASLREAAYDQYRTACLRLGAPMGATCDFTALPAALQGFFGKWVAAELARLEREVAIRSLERQMEIALVELDAVREDLEGQRQAGRLLSLLPAWSLRTNDAHTVRRPSTDLGVILGEQLYPHVAIRYPKTLDRIAADTELTGVLLRLSNASWSSRIEDLAADLRAAAAGITSKLQITMNEANATREANLTTVAVSFDNPHYIPPTAFDPDKGELVPVWPVNNYRKADEARAIQVWNAIEDVMATPALRSIVPFTILPEDVYSPSGASILICERAAPVIQAMAVYIARTGSENVGANGEGWSGTTRIDSEMTFATSEGPSLWVMKNDEYSNDQVPFLFGEAVDGPTTFRDLAGYPNAVAAGLSPFTSFEVNMSGLHALSFNPFDDRSAYAVIVLFQLDPRATGTTLEWVKSCVAP